MRGRREDAFARFFERVAVDDSGCWLWTGALNSNGYGTFNPEPGQKVYAHRWSYEQQVGEIPTGKQLDHLCRVRACIRPSHLEPVTNAENQRRAPKAMKTHCIRGHEFTAANTYRHTITGARQCRACRALGQRTASKGRAA